MKIINASILIVIILLVSITAIGASFQKPRVKNDPNGPYTPKDLQPPVLAISSIVALNFNGTQAIPTPQAPVDYIDIYTTKDYQNFVYKAGTNLTIPLYLKLVSHTKLTANVTIDPHNPYTCYCAQSLGPDRGEILLNDYMKYDYNGTLELRNGTLTKVILTISIPSGLWPYPETTHIPFNLLGVDSVDNHVFVATRFSGEIDL